MHQLCYGYITFVYIGRRNICIVKQTKYPQLSMLRVETFLHWNMKLPKSNLESAALEIMKRFKILFPGTSCVWSAASISKMSASINVLPIDPPQHPIHLTPFNGCFGGLLAQFCRVTTSTSATKTDQYPAPTAVCEQFGTIVFRFRVARVREYRWDYLAYMEIIGGEFEEYFSKSEGMLELNEQVKCSMLILLGVKVYQANTCLLWVLGVFEWRITGLSWELFRRVIEICQCCFIILSINTKRWCFGLYAY